ncbi:MAG: 50S ribosomal protein L13 [Candidatus Dojkabacteria bacterium]|jgi:large subunit ribosomal protein L13
MKYKTEWTKKEDVKREWYLVDAQDLILGRLATRVASLLIGKGKPEIVPNVDCGDYVVVINSDKVKLSRGKENKKIYYRHSGYPGGWREVVFADQMKRDSTKVVVDAVKNMIPKNKLRDLRMNRLFVYPAGEHKHGGQNPKEYKF